MSTTTVYETVERLQTDLDALEAQKAGVQADLSQAQSFAIVADVETAIKAQRSALRQARKLAVKERQAKVDAIRAELEPAQADHAANIERTNDARQAVKAAEQALDDAEKEMRRARHARARTAQRVNELRAELARWEVQ